MATRQQPTRQLASFDELDAAGIGAGYTPYGQSNPEQPVKEPVKPTGFWRGAGDIGLSAGQGAVGAFKALSDLAGADNSISQGLGSTNEFLGDLKSDKSKVTMQNSVARIKAAEESGSTSEEVKAYMGMLFDQPGEMLAQAAGSFATLGIGKAAQALRLAGAAKAAGVSKSVFLASDVGKKAAQDAAQFGFKTNIGVGAGMGVGAVKGSQFEQTYENAIKQGQSPEEAQALADEAQSYGGAGTMQQLLGGGLGAVASATGPIERMIAGTGKEAAKTGIMRGMATGFAKEAPLEGLQGGQERYAGNEAAIDAGVLDSSQSMRGVVGQVLQEGTLGGVLGSAAGGIEGYQGEVKPTTPPSDLPATPLPITPPPGPMTRAVSAGALTVIPPEAPAGSAEFVNSSFADRARNVQTQLADSKVRDAMRAKFGNEAFAEAGYYATAANNPGLPEKTRSNMLGMAERLISDLFFNEVPGVSGISSDPSALQGTTPLPQIGMDDYSQPFIGEDLGPSGRMTVDGEGNAMPETRVQASDARRRADGIESMGKQAPRATPEIIRTNEQDLADLVDSERRDLQTMQAQFDQDRQKQVEIDAAYEAKPALDAVQRAAAIDSPNVMQSAFNQLADKTIGPEPAPPDQPVAPPKEPRVVPRTPDMQPMPKELAELQVSMDGGEVARVQNRNGKFGYVVVPKAAPPAQNPALAAAADTGAAVQDSDILNRLGSPFTNLFAAKTEAGKQGAGFEPVKLSEKAFVVRKAALVPSVTAPDNARPPANNEPAGLAPLAGGDATAVAPMASSDMSTFASEIRVEQDQWNQLNARADIATSPAVKQAQAQFENGDIDAPEFEAAIVAGEQQAQPTATSPTSVPVAGQISTPATLKKISKKDATEIFSGKAKSEADARIAPEKTAFSDFLASSKETIFQDLLSKRAAKDLLSEAQEDQFFDLRRERQDAVIASDNYEKLQKLEDPAAGQAPTVQNNTTADPLKSALDSAYVTALGARPFSGGIVKTAEKLHRALVSQDASALADILRPGNKISRAAFQSIMPKAKLPADEAGMKAFAEDFTGRVSAKLATTQSAPAETQDSQANYTATDVVESPVSLLSLSGDVPQFKSNSDANGITQGAKLEGKYDRRMASPIQVWQRNDGRMEVVSGRHRFDLAQRSGETTIPTQIYKESDGFTADMARTLDIELNVKDGRGKVKDYVAYFKEIKPTREQARANGLLNTAIGRQAHTISDSGGETLISSHANNALTDDAAVSIAQNAPNNDALQGLGMQHVANGKTINFAVNVMRAAKAAGFDGGSVSSDLFGFDDSFAKEAEAIAKEASSQQHAIRQQIAAIRGASKRPELAAQGGVNVKNPKVTQNKITELEGQLAGLDGFSTNPDIYRQLRVDAGLAPKGEAAPDQSPGSTISQTEPENEGPLTPVRDGAQENRVWVEKDIGYAPNRAKGKSYQLVSRSDQGIAAAFKAVPKHSDMVQYFASPDEAATWASENGYSFGASPYAKSAAFTRRGDYWNFTGSNASEIAKTLELTVLKSDGGKPMVSIPEHSRAQMAKGLQRAGIPATFDAAPTADEGLTAPTKQEVLDQQTRADNAAALDDKAQVDREAAGQTLTRQTAPEQRRDTSGDMFPMEKATAEIDRRNAGQAANTDPNQDAMFSRSAPNESIPEKNALKALSENDELFALPKSNKETIEGIAAETDPGITVKKLNHPGLVQTYVLTMPDGGRARMMIRPVNPYGAQTYGSIDHGDGKIEALTERPGDNAESVSDDMENVYIDVSALKEGGQGARIYNIAATLAHNTGRILIGDPAGLSDVAMRRRTENMLSSALKFGTTSHIAPHPRQIEGVNGIGVPPLQWTYGDDLGNIKSLIQTSLESLDHAGANLLTFDIPTGTFRDSEGRVLDDSAIRQIVESRRRPANRAGITTYKRGAVLSALVREEGAKGSTGGKGAGILAQLVDVGREFPASSKGIFYNRGIGGTAGLPASKVQATVDAIKALWSNAPRVVVADNMADPRIPQAARDENQKQQSQGATGNPEGFLHEGTVYLVADQLATADDVARVLMHEALGHAGLRGVFGENLEPILQQLATMRKADVAAKAKQYGLDMNKEADRLTAAEEVLAEMAQSRPEIGFVKRAIAIIRGWLRDNVPGFSNIKMTDAEIITRFILPARNFVERGRGGPGGEVALGRDDSFNKWFSNSKVVDSDGKAMVVYHGTSKDFSQFNQRKDANFQGFYFSSSSSYAGMYSADSGGDGANLMPVYLSIKNPLIVDGDKFEINGVKKLIAKALMGKRYKNNIEANRWRVTEGATSNLTATDIVELKRLGFDGVMNYTSNEIVAFDARQIKSATGNNGAFDATNPDIRFSRATSNEATPNGGDMMFSRSEDKNSGSQEFQPLADQSSAKALNATLVQYGLGQDWSTAYAAVKLPDALSGIRQAFQTAFGRDIRAVAPTEARFDIFNGVYIPSQPNSIYVNVNNKVGFVQVAGHELWHAIRRNRPDLINWYRQHSRQYYKDLPAYQEKLNKLLQSGEKAYSLDKAEEELEADFLGDSLADPIFLQQLADASPTKFKELLSRVRLWLTGVVNKLRGLDSSKEVTDVEALRTHLTKVMTAFAEGKAFPANPNGVPMFSRSTVGQASWNSPEASKFDDLIYKLQDKMIDTKRVVESIKATTGALADRVNVYLQEELFHGRAAARTEDFINKELGPLVNMMRMRGIDIATLDEYLHARHAEEANDLIADRNPEILDGGSGMTTQAARDYLAKLTPAERAKLDAVAAKVDTILAGTRQLYADYDLESQAKVDGWGEMFAHYVPLMREDKDGGMGIGQGFSIKGKEVKGRTGSTRKVVDILANIALQREKVIVRGEKNRVATALVGLVKLNPNKEFWHVGPPPATKVYDPASNSVVERQDPMYKSRDNVIVAKIKGKDGFVTEQAVTFSEDDPRAVRMAAALKNLDAAQLEGLLGVSAKITRYFSAINTQFNPIFGMVNFVRDVQGAAINLTSTPLKGKEMKVLAGTMSALKGIYVDARAARQGKTPTSEWATLWEEFQDEGGQTGFRDLFAKSSDRADAIKRELDPSAWMDSPMGKVFTANGALKVPLAVAQKKAKGIFDWLSDYNLATENAVRLAAYKVALDQGMSKQQAASLGKNLTVNFNRKGQVGQQAGALYAFFNASMQGTARMGATLFDMDKADIKTLRLSKTGKKIVYGGVLLGVMQSLLLAAAGFDDDEPSDFVRERSLIIPTGGKSYITIPMPLGLHVLPNIGRIPTEWAMGGFKKPTERVADLITVAAGSFNPIGGGASLVQMLSPTIIDPIVAIAENKDWTGKPIAKTSYNRAIPGYLLAKDTASAPAKIIAEALNYLSGGTEYTPGVWSPTPDQIDYLWGQATGGVGREISKAQQTLSSAVSGEEMPIYKVPVLGRFYGNTDGQAAQSSRFYNAINTLNLHESSIKGMRADGRGAEAAQYIRDNPDARLYVAANSAERDVQKMRREKRALMDKDATADQIRAIETRIGDRMTRFNMVVQAQKDRARAIAD